MAEIDTKELEHQLSVSNSIEDITEMPGTIPQLSVSQYLEQLLKEHNLKRAQVIRESNLERTYGNKIFSGLKNTGRTKLLAIAVAMHLTHQEVQRLLYYANENKLYVKEPWDRIIWYGLEKKLTVGEVNIILNDLKMSPLLE